MQTDKIISCLMLNALITPTQYTAAPSFCASSSEGKIRLDNFNRYSYNECMRASGNKGVA